MIRRLQVRSSAGIFFFFSPELTFGADCHFGIRSISVLPEYNVKDPGHSAKSANGRLYVNTHMQLIQRSGSGQTI